MLKRYRDEEYITEWRFIHEGDLDEIAAPCDSLGINYYSRGIIRSDKVPEAENAPVEVTAIGEPTDMATGRCTDRLRRPSSVFSASMRLSRSTSLRMALRTRSSPNERGEVHDERRLTYLHEHLRACHQAIEEEVELSSYFGWSLMDNFEWAFGYEKRFGLVYVDYETLERTPKA